MSLGQSQTNMDNVSHVVFARPESLRAWFCHYMRPALSFKKLPNAT
jgi:hypothetical protein